jgi:hypothetical protein
MLTVYGGRKNRNRLTCAPHFSNISTEPVTIEPPWCISCLAFLASTILVGCTPASAPADEATQRQVNRPPVIRSASISPNVPTLNKPVTVQIDAQDFDGDPLTFHYKWLANGSPIVGKGGGTLTLEMLKRSDKLAVEVIPHDGKIQGVPYRTKEVVIGNALPELTRVVLEPRGALIADPIQAKAEGSDADEDTIDYRFRWYRNNKEISEGEENTLDTTDFARGDIITVQVIPYDSVGGKGKAMFAEPVMIANSPPKITSVPPSAISRGLFQYPVTAIDPDGDPLTYSLETGISGMKLDKTTGRLEWSVSPGTKGAHRVRIKVLDSHDGFAFQEFDLIFPPQTVSPRRSHSKSFQRDLRLVSHS